MQKFNIRFILSLEKLILFCFQGWNLRCRGWKIEEWKIDQKTASASLKDECFQNTIWQDLLFFIHTLKEIKNRMAGLFLLLIQAFQAQPTDSTKFKEREGGGMEEGQEMGEMNGGEGGGGKKWSMEDILSFSNYKHLIGHLQWKYNGQLLSIPHNFM